MLPENLKLRGTSLERVSRVEVVVVYVAWDGEMRIVVVIVSFGESGCNGSDSDCRGGALVLVMVLLL